MILILNNYDKEVKFCCSLVIAVDNRNHFVVTSLTTGIVFRLFDYLVTKK